MDYGVWGSEVPSGSMGKATVGIMGFGGRSPAETVALLCFTYTIILLARYRTDSTDSISSIYLMCYVTQAICGLYIRTMSVKKEETAFSSALR